MKLTIDLSGEIEASVDDQERVMIDLASGRLERDAFLNWLRQHMKSAG